MQYPSLLTSLSRRLLKTTYLELQLKLKRIRGFLGIVLEAIPSNSIKTANYNQDDAPNAVTKSPSSRTSVLRDTGETPEVGYILKLG